MRVTVTERVTDLDNDVDAANGAIVVSLDPADAARGGTWAYAALLVAAPVARRDGVAVVLGDEHVDGVPDPCVVLVRSERGAAPACALELRRRGLPVLLEVDPATGTAVVVRRIGRAAPVELERAAPRATDRPPDPPPAPPGRKVG